MKLTVDQIDTLNGLLKHPGWKIVKQIDEHESNVFFDKLRNINLKDDKGLATLAECQLYDKARRDFIKDIEKHGNTTTEFELKLY